MPKQKYPISSFEPSEPLENDIKIPIERLINHLLEWKDMPIENGFDVKTICTLICIHIDFLGYLFSGGKKESESAEKAVEFMREYFGQVDERYRECSGLVYYVLRHGLVHKSLLLCLALASGQTCIHLCSARD